MAIGAQRLQGEAVRHTVAIVAATLLTTVIVLVAAVVADGAIDRDSYSLLGIMLMFACYGPVFLLLNRIAFGRLRGSALRADLERSTERRRLVRLLYLGGPKSWAVLIVVLGIGSVLLVATGGAIASPWLVAVSVACVVGTWVLLVAVFAVEYMRAWAAADALRFPGGGELEYQDFVYLSVQLSTTFSSADVELLATPVRRLATVHSIVAFAYGTVVIAVLASLLISLSA